MEPQKTQNCQINLRKKERSWRYYPPRLQTILQSCSHHNSLVFSTTNCWTIIDRKTLELTKKDTPHPKTKEKLQGDGRRGEITIKSNPITAGWVIRKLENTYTTEVHSLEWRFWPHTRLPNLGVWQSEEEFLENQTLKASGICLQGFDRTEGNRDYTLGGHTRVVCTWGPRGRSSDPIRDWTRPTC